MYSWETLWPMLLNAGIPGIVIALLVLAFVYIGDFTDVFPSGTVKRWAVVVTGALFSGVKLGDQHAAVVGAISIALATGAHLLIEAVKSELNKRNAGKK